MAQDNTTGISDEPFVFIDDVAKRFGVTRVTVDAWIKKKEGGMPYYQAMPYSRLRFRLSEVDAWHAKGGATADTPDS